MVIQDACIGRWIKAAYIFPDDWILLRSVLKSYIYVPFVAESAELDLCEMAIITFSVSCCRSQRMNAVVGAVLNSVLFDILCFCSLVGGTNILTPPKYLKELQHPDFLDPNATPEGAEEPVTK